MVGMGVGVWQESWTVFLVDAPELLQSTAGIKERRGFVSDEHAVGEREPPVVLSALQEDGGSDLD
jgi:hypothetical protein